MTQRVFTKEVLKSCNTMARIQNYNRYLTDEFLETLDDNKFYVPKYTLLHEHRAGEPCAPHVRCVFDSTQAHFMIDVEMGCWELLPTVPDMMNRLRTETKETAAAE